MFYICIINIHQKFTKSKKQYIMTTQTVILTQKARLALRNNKRLRLAVMDRWNRWEWATIKYWFKNNDPRLVHPDTLALICAYEKCEASELTEVSQLQTADVI